LHSIPPPSIALTTRIATTRTPRCTLRDRVCDPSNVDEDCDGLVDDLDPQGDAAGKTIFYTDLITKAGTGPGTTRCDRQAR
jgi:hypothetical protein